MRRAGSARRAMEVPRPIPLLAGRDRAFSEVVESLLEAPDSPAADGYDRARRNRQDGFGVDCRSRRRQQISGMAFTTPR